MTDDEESTVDDSVADDSADGTRLTCVACGSAIDPTEWHPVRTRIDADGDFHLDPFCSVECRAAME